MPAQLSICVCTAFYPSVGGVETLAEELARQWTAAGHRVTIVTNVAASAVPPRHFDFEVLHRPSPAQLLRSARKCDVFVHNNVSLKFLWPLGCVRRPYVAVHHGWYGRHGNGDTSRDRFKLRVARRWAYNVSVSKALNNAIGVQGAVIPNLFNDAKFRLLDKDRNTDLVFVGRLVSDKGADVLLRAMARLRSRKICPALSIVGDGPERPLLEQMVRDTGLTKQVSFCGPKNHDELPEILNRHRIMVVPSLVKEGFGIVALEGAGCGCAVVASSHGGLPEAVGPCGVTFPSGDDRRLADVLECLVKEPSQLEKYRIASSEHLARHRPHLVASRYIDFFKTVLGGRAEAATCGC